MESNLAGLASRHARASREASSGYRVSSPSTDPRAAAEIAKTRHAIERAQGFRSNIGAARADTELAEGVLAEASSVYERVQELAVQAANGTLGPDERTAMATEINGLKSQLVSLANTRGANGYLFAGSATTTEPFGPTGVFSGNSDAHPIEIGPKQVVNVAIDGAKAFTSAGGDDVFLLLDTLAAALNANDQRGVITTLDSVRNAHGQLVRSRADTGMLLDRLNISESALDQGDAALKTHQANLSEADATATYSELISVQNSIEQAVAVARRVLNIQRFEP